MKIKLFLLVVLFSFILECLTGLLRGFASFMISSFAGFILFFVLTIFSIKALKSKTNEFIIFLALLTGLCAVQIPIRISSWDNTLVSLPDFLLHLLGIVTGYIFIKTRRSVGVGVALTGLAIAMFMLLRGYDLWINKVSYGTYTGNVLEKVPEFKICDSTHCLTNESAKNKLIVLDFWTTACGVCFSKFPALQEKYDKYKANENIEFYAVNIHLTRDTLNQAANTLKRLHYTFPLIVIDDDTLVKKFQISGVPVTIIIKNGMSIVYRGDIAGIDDIIKKYKKNH